MSDHETIRDQAAIRASWDGDCPDVTRIVRRVGAALNSGRDAAVVEVVLDEVQRASEPMSDDDMLTELVNRGVLKVEDSHRPVDEAGEAWHARSLERALQDAADNPVGGTWSDGLPRVGIVKVVHGRRYESAQWHIVGEIVP